MAGRRRPDKTQPRVAVGEGAGAGMFAQRLALVSMTEDPRLTFRTAGGLWGWLTGLPRRMPASWLPARLPRWTPAQPAHPFLRHRDGKPRWTPGGQTHASPLLHASSRPATEPFTERSTPPAVWEGGLCSVCMWCGRPRTDVCEVAVCLCVPKCEITPSGVLNRREEGQPGRPDVLAAPASPHIWNRAPTPAHHVPGSTWHRTLAVTLSVYWLGCPGVADQPLGLREALSPSPPFPCIPPLCSWGARTETHAPGHSGKWGLKIKPREAGEGPGHVYYNEDMHQLYTIQHAEVGRTGWRVPQTGPPPAGRPPTEEWPLQVSQ